MKVDDPCARPFEHRGDGELAAEVGDIDILINNAGDIPAGSLEILDDAAWRRGFDLKVFGYITLSRALLSADEGQGRRDPQHHRQFR